LLVTSLPTPRGFCQQAPSIFAHSFCKLNAG
jgi:hypothetical protein